ncbi:hypothetical protein ACWEQ7_29625, partial [Streptomyces sp. NPDC004069]
LGVRLEHAGPFHLYSGAEGLAGELGALLVEVPGAAAPPCTARTTPLLPRSSPGRIFRALDE